MGIEELLTWYLETEENETNYFVTKEIFRLSYVIVARLSIEGAYLHLHQKRLVSLAMKNSQHLFECFS